MIVLMRFFKRKKPSDKIISNNTIDEIQKFMKENKCEDGRFTLSRNLITGNYDLKIYDYDNNIIYDSYFPTIKNINKIER